MNILNKLFFSLVTIVFVGAIAAQEDDVSQLLGKQKHQVVQDEAIVFSSYFKDTTSESSGGMNQPPVPTESVMDECVTLREYFAEHGISGKSELIQFYQGVTSGGTEQRFRYGGKLNLFLEFDTGKLGLWEGGKLESHAVDWQFGRNSIRDAVAFAPVNTSLITPTPGPQFALTSLVYTQGFPTGHALQFGRINMLDLWSGFFPEYGRGNDGFMNLSALLPLNVVPSLPLITNGAGIIKVGEKGIEAAFYALDSQQTATTAGFKFPNGVTMLGALRKYTEFGGLSGSHTLLGIYATGDYTSFDQSGWIIIPGAGLIPSQQRGTWAAAYVGEQRLWEDLADPKRNVKLFGYIALSDVDTSPFAWTSSVSLETFGPFASRTGDRAGIAYFYNSLNHPFQNVASIITPISSVHGGEIYYNFELSPAFHLTADLQAIKSEIRSQDTALVLGLRAKLDF